MFPDFEWSDFRSPLYSGYLNSEHLNTKLVWYSDPHCVFEPRFCLDRGTTGRHGRGGNQP